MTSSLFVQFRQGCRKNAFAIKMNAFVLDNVACFPMCLACEIVKSLVGTTFQTVDREARGSL
jgi:hypothetical protein